MCLCCVQVAWTSFHKNKKMVRKHLAQYHIGKISPEQKAVYIYADSYLRTCLTQVLHVIFLCCLYIASANREGFYGVKRKDGGKGKETQGPKTTCHP